MTWARRHYVLLIVMAVALLAILSVLLVSLGSDSAGSP
jgi:hypothetical protein